MMKVLPESLPADARAAFAITLLSDKLVKKKDEVKQ